MNHSFELIKMKDKTMELENYGPDIEALEKLYSLYDATLKDFLDQSGEQPACGKGCADCCTCNVTMTSLEAAFFVEYLGKEHRGEVAETLKARFPKKRYIPSLTTNGFAGHCLAGKEIPEDENDPSWGKCPLLQDHICTVYEARPFGCRSMVSQTPCSRSGFARMPPLVLTLNNIFLQTIEHLDYQGVSGNLSDMLSFFLNQEKTIVESGWSGLMKGLSGKGDSLKTMIRNSKIPALMVPPEHRDAVGPLLKQITTLT